MVHHKESAFILDCLEYLFKDLDNQLCNQWLLSSLRQKAIQTCILNMIIDEAQANTDLVTSITVVVGILVRVLSIFRFSRSFVSSELHCMSIRSNLS